MYSLHYFHVVVSDLFEAISVWFLTLEIKKVHQLRNQIILKDDCQEM